VAGLPAYLRPQGIHLVGDMPRTETGKLRRGVLGKMLDQVPVRPAAEQAP
jgi:acyl-coenzyme A synthetase/AMP-(fatty) acid ligase